MNAPEQACALDQTLLEQLALGLQPSASAATGSHSHAAASFSEPNGALAKGQLWQLSATYLEIVQATPKLVHYRLVRHPGQKALTRVMRTEALQAYLKDQGAVLAL